MWLEREVFQDFLYMLTSTIFQYINGPVCDERPFCWKFCSGLKLSVKVLSLNFHAGLVGEFRGQGKSAILSLNFVLNLC